MYCRVSAYCSGTRQYNTPACLCMHTVYAYIAACGHIAEVPCTAKAPLPGRHRRPRCLQAATPLLGFLELLSQLKQNVFRSTVSVPQRLKSAHSALNRHCLPCVTLCTGVAGVHICTYTGIAPPPMPHIHIYRYLSGIAPPPMPHIHICRYSTSADASPWRLFLIKLSLSLSLSLSPSLSPSLTIFVELPSQLKQIHLEARYHSALNRHCLPRTSLVPL